MHLGKYVKPLGEDTGIYRLLPRQVDAFKRDAKTCGCQVDNQVKVSNFIYLEVSNRRLK